MEKSLRYKSDHTTNLFHHILNFFIQELKLLVTAYLISKGAAEIEYLVSKASLARFKQFVRFIYHQPLNAVIKNIKEVNE